MAISMMSEIEMLLKLTKKSLMTEKISPIVFPPFVLLKIFYFIILDLLTVCKGDKHEFFLNFFHFSQSLSYLGNKQKGVFLKNSFLHSFSR